MLTRQAVLTGIAPDVSERMARRVLGTGRRV